MGTKSRIDIGPGTLATESGKTYTKVAAATSAYSAALNYDTGASTGWEFSPGSGWSNSTSSGGLDAGAHFSGYPDDAIKDGIGYTGTVAGSGRVMTVRGLTAANKYRMRVVGAYNSGTHVGNYEVYQDGAYGDLQTLDCTDNLSNYAEWADLVPVADVGGSGYYGISVRVYATSGNAWANLVEIEETFVNLFASVNSGTNAIIDGDVFTIAGTSMDTVTAIGVRSGSTEDSVTIYSASTTLVTSDAYLRSTVPFGVVEIFGTDGVDEYAISCTYSPQAGYSYLVADSPSTADGSIFSLFSGEAPSTGDQLLYPDKTRNGYAVTIDEQGFPTIDGGTGTDYIDGVDYHNGAEWIGAVNVEILDGNIVNPSSTNGIIREIVVGMVAPFAYKM